MASGTAALAATSPETGPSFGRKSWCRLRKRSAADKTRQYIQGWQGFIRVDGHVYNWMGNAPGGDGLVNQTSLEYTSTRSVFTFNVVDKVEMMVEFLSPVYPEDLRRQSVTSSYINISVKSLDGKTHSVQIYSDVSGGGFWRTSRCKSAG